MSVRRMNITVRACGAGANRKQAHSAHMYHLWREANKNAIGNDKCGFWSYFWCDGLEPNSAGIPEGETPA